MKIINEIKNYFEVRKLAKNYFSSKIIKKEKVGNRVYYKITYSLKKLVRLNNFAGQQVVNLAGFAGFTATSAVNPISVIFVPNDKEFEPYVETAYAHEVGHIAHGDIDKGLASNKPEETLADISASLWINNEAEKAADQYAFERTGIKINKEFLLDMLLTGLRIEGNIDNYDSMRNTLSCNIDSVCEGRF